MSENIYEVVEQDNGYYTIFKGAEQYCDDDGNPMRYESYEEARDDCDALNEQFDIWFDKIQEQLEEI